MRTVGALAWWARSTRSCLAGPDAGRILITDALAVESRYTHEHFAVTLKRPGPLWVRIPSWVDLRQLTRSVDGSQIVGEYLFIPDLPGGCKLELPYDLPTSDLLLRHRSRDIRVQLRGDSVEAMDNFGADLIFFDPLE